MADPAILTVSDLNARARLLLEEGLGWVWIRGERQLAPLAQMPAVIAMTGKVTHFMPSVENELQRLAVGSG